MKRLSIRQTGFTLLEVLVAIGIFAVVAIVSYSTLDTYLDLRERLTIHYSKLERLQRLFILFERDIQFAVGRSVRQDGDVRSAIESEQEDVLISMTVAQPDVRNAAGIALKRVEWKLDGNELTRLQWDFLDHGGNIDAAELLVSDEIEALELSYYFYTSNQGLDAESSLEGGAFPNGVELNVTLKSGAAYRRVFLMVNGG